VIKTKKKFWNFKAAANHAGELYLYGNISDSSWWGDEVTPLQFKADLDALGEIAQLSIYINSPGGDVFAGQAIHSMLKRHSAEKTVYVDGLAASIASVIAMAGDKIIMPSNAMMMLHNPWTMAYGNANDFRKMADDLDQIGKSILAVYREKSGMENEKIQELMDNETWLTAEDAMGYGLADKIDKEKQVAASLRNGTLLFNGLSMDAGQFKRLPIDKISFFEAAVTPEPAAFIPGDLYGKLQKINERRQKI
jgi:ATP-dependent Clp protease protease subunit